MNPGIVPARRSRPAAPGMSLSLPAAPAFHRYRRFSPGSDGFDDGRGAVHGIAGGKNPLPPGRKSIRVYLYKITGYGIHSEPCRYLRSLPYRENHRIGFKDMPGVLPHLYLRVFILVKSEGFDFAEC